MESPYAMVAPPTSAASAGAPGNQGPTDAPDDPFFGTQEYGADPTFGLSRAKLEGGLGVVAGVSIPEADISVYGESTWLNVTLSGWDTTEGIMLILTLQGDTTKWIDAGATTSSGGGTEGVGAQLSGTLCATQLGNWSWEIDAPAHTVTVELTTAPDDPSAVDLTVTESTATSVGDSPSGTITGSFRLPRALLPHETFTPVADVGWGGPGSSTTPGPEWGVYNPAPVNLLASEWSVEGAPPDLTAPASAAVAVTMDVSGTYVGVLAVSAGETTPVVGWDLNLPIVLEHLEDGVLELVPPSEATFGMYNHRVYSTWPGDLASMYTGAVGQLVGGTVERAGSRVSLDLRFAMTRDDGSNGDSPFEVRVRCVVELPEA